MANDKEPEDVTMKQRLEDEKMINELRRQNAEALKAAKAERDRKEREGK